MPVNVAQAALGDTVEIPLLKGEAQQVKVPTGVQTGTVLRFKGQGVPAVENGRRGDLLVMVQVVTPKRLDPRTRRLFQELAKVLNKETPGKSSPNGPRAEKAQDALGTEDN
jgi:molecular chaperone DnaJ